MRKVQNIVALLLLSQFSDFGAVKAATTSVPEQTSQEKLEDMMLQSEIRGSSMNGDTPIQPAELDKIEEATDDMQFDSLKAVRTYAIRKDVFGDREKNAMLDDEDDNQGTDELVNFDNVQLDE